MHIHAVDNAHCHNAHAHAHAHILNQQNMQIAISNYSLIQQITNYFYGSVHFQ